ncbi:MAG: hypothetical protein KAG94_03895 [Clostridiales bacterium]|nr:hypothetical protein [Clostridiales bacterium]
MMKKVIITILLICLLVSCTAAPEEEKIIYTPLEPADSLNIQCLGSTSDKYFEYETWSVYLKIKYNISIKLNYDSDTDVNIIYVKKGNYLYSNVTGGYDRFANSQNALDLSKYYKRYEWNQYIDEKYINHVTNNDGIYSIPIVSSGYVTPRFYKKELLEQLEMDVPTTVGQFYDFLLEAKKLNSDIETYTPIYLNYRNLVPGLFDIFRGYNLYLNNSWGYSTIGYNPNTQSFEDVMFSPAIYEVGDYIHNLLENDLLYIYGHNDIIISITSDNPSKPVVTIYNPFETELYPSQVHFATELYRNPEQGDLLGNYNANIPDYDYLKGYYLSGSNEQNLVKVHKDISFYIFPKTLSNPDETVELFNQIFTNNKYFYDFSYGIEGSNYTRENEETTLIKPIVGSYPNLQLLTSKEKYLPQTLDNIFLATAPSLLFYEENTFDIKTSYFLAITKDENNFEPFILLFDKDVTVVDAVMEYRKIFMESGMKDKVKERNDMIGTTSHYTYTIGGEE